MTANTPAYLGEYLGDGAYVVADGWYLWLSAERGGTTHRVALEPDGLIALVAYARSHGYAVAARDHDGCRHHDGTCAAIADANEAMGEALVAARADVERLTPPRMLAIGTDSRDVPTLWDLTGGRADPICDASHTPAEFWAWLERVVTRRADGEAGE